MIIIIIIIIMKWFPATSRRPVKWLKKEERFIIILWLMKRCCFAVQSLVICLFSFKTNDRCSSRLALPAPTAPDRRLELGFKPAALHSAVDSPVTDWAAAALPLWLQLLLRMFFCNFMQFAFLTCFELHVSIFFSFSFPGRDVCLVVCRPGRLESRAKLQSLRKAF